MSKTTKLREWKLWARTDNDRVKGYVLNSGLTSLVQCSYRTVDKVLVSAFVERWHPETNTFHLPFGEMTITLDDVANILGIPVGGAPVATLVEDNITCEYLLTAYLGVSGDQASEQLMDFGGEYVRLEWLRTCFSDVTDADSEHEIQCAARAYLLYLLGCTLFVDKTGTRVQVQYLRLLTNLDTVSHYAWGAGCLAWLFRQFGFASRAGVKQIGGYMTLIEAWVYEHMHTIFGPAYDMHYSENTPRALRWTPRRDGGSDLEAVQRIRQRLDVLSADEVDL